jgi:hypothetical protein
LLGTALPPALAVVCAAAAQPLAPRLRCCLFEWLRPYKIPASVDDLFFAAQLPLYLQFTVCPLPYFELHELFMDSRLPVRRVLPARSKRGASNFILMLSNIDL